MGYDTTFDGNFFISPGLDSHQVAYLQAFSETRRMSRDAKRVEDMPDPLREAVNLPLGPEAGYFVGGVGGQDYTDDIIDRNLPPKDQPGLYCQWTVTDDGQTLEWDGGEKFYSYVEWLHYLIEHFFMVWGRTLTGEVEWVGEDNSDQGRIKVKDNVILVENIDASANDLGNYDYGPAMETPHVPGEVETLVQEIIDEDIKNGVPAFSGMEFSSKMDGMNVVFKNSSVGTMAHVKLSEMEGKCQAPKEALEKVIGEIYSCYGTDEEQHAFFESLNDELREFGWIDFQPGEFLHDLIQPIHSFQTNALICRSAVDHVLKYKLSFEVAIGKPWEVLRDLDTSGMTILELTKRADCPESYVRALLTDLDKSWDEGGIEGLVDIMTGNLGESRGI